MFVPVLKFLLEVKTKSNAYSQHIDKFISYLFNAPTLEESYYICEYFISLKNFNDLLLKRLNNLLKKQIKHHIL
jgi:hypothetical protein